LFTLTFLAAAAVLRYRVARLTTALFVLTMAVSVSADFDDLPLAELHRQTWTTRDGIPHNTVNAIAQTPDGYLWLATWEGVARFNGHRFRVYERSPETGLPDSGVLSLSLDGQGQLVVAGARGGVVITDGQQWLPLERAHGQAMITHARMARHDQLWLATQGGGVLHRRLGPDLETIEETRLLPDASAYWIAPDADGRVWVATSRGLLRVSGDESVLFDAEHGLPPVPVLSILHGSGTDMLVGTENGLYQRQAEARSFQPLDLAFQDMAISTLLRDKGGAIWVGTVAHGLFRIAADGRINRLGTADGLPNNRVLALHEDFEGSLWVGTNGGLFRLREAPFVTYTRRQGLAGNFVRVVMPHSDGSLWVGTSEGVSRLFDGRIEPVTIDGSELTLSTLSLAELANGDVLIGTHSDGVLRWRDGRLLGVYDRSSGLPSNDIRIMVQDSRERIWIGTAGGLVRMDDDGLRVFTPEDGLPGNFIIALHEDSEGRVWVGTGFGLAGSLGERFEAISLLHLDEAMYVYGIHTDPQRDSLWLATDRGLIRFDPASGDMTIVGRVAGLPIDKLFQAVQDQRGGMWLTSNRGILRIDRENAHAFADGRADAVDYELYAEGDGMVSAQANGGAGPAAAWHAGRIWIATAAGVAAVDPDFLTRYEDSALPVSIERFEVDGRSIPLVARGFELQPGTSRIAIGYAGLGFVMPQRIQYRTRLDGFDDDWVFRSSQSIAEYTNLGPGTYTFRVSAAYPSGSWNDSEASIRFSIAPLPWQQPWFWIGVALAGLVMLAALIQLRMRQLQRRARVLHDQVNEKTRELKHQAQAFERQARVDELTGLANRRAFDEWLADAFDRTRKSGKTLCVVVMDLDHFKQVNDRFDHTVGDEVMRIVANVLRDHIRQGDQAARWGGEEFTLTFPDCHSARAARICERIRQAIEAVDLSGTASDLRITASFGISDSSHAETYTELVRQADQALYKAKEQGRNRVVQYGAGKPR